MDVQTVDGHVVWITYTPSKGAAWAFLIMFAIATVGHFFLMCPYRASYFIPMVIGGIMETCSYYGRAWLSENKNNFSAFVLYNLLNIPAPVFISMTLYLSLGRIIRALEAQDQASLGPKAITAIFVINDIICFCLQIAGVGLQATTDSHVREIGGHVVLAGMIFQILVFAWFVLIAYRFHSAMKHNPTSIASDPRIPSIGKHMWVIYASSGCIMLRNLVRAIEYGQGGRGSIASNEVFLYVFDGALMLIVMAVYLVIHPGLLLRKIRKSKLRDVEANMSWFKRRKVQKQRKRDKKQQEKDEKQRRKDEKQAKKDEKQQRKAEKKARRP
ncbi:hypothetical protein KC354_g7946 [Hortaea werneckii]|nr:hypothetical protein KC354_g7946 [Hortaea werneckii]